MKSGKLEIVDMDEFRRIITNLSDRDWVVYWSKASGVVRLDGIGLMFASEWDSSMWSSKPTLILKRVQSLRRTGLEPSQNNRCQTNDQSGVIKPQMRGSCKRATDLLV